MTDKIPTQEFPGSPHEQFRAAAAQRHLVLPSEMVVDGNIHRCPIVGRTGNDGAYLLHAGGLFAGGFENHADCRGWEHWRTDLGRPLTKLEKDAYQKQVKADRVASEAVRAGLRAEAAEKARQIWNTAKPCEDHPSLLRKDVRSHGLREKDGDLVVPVRTPKGELTSIQTIAPDGAKWFLTGGRKKGCMFMLGSVGDGPLYIAEGYATGATIYKATGQPVVVAFDAGNLIHVAKGLRDLYPDVDFIFCADDDLTEGNPGLKCATEAAQAVQGRVVVPDWGENRPDRATDFNDMAQHRGLEAVKACVEGQARPVEPENLTEAVKRLAALEKLDYEKVRVSEAKKLGIRTIALDDAVVKARQAQQADSGQGVMFPEVKPWPSPVDPATLLDEIRATFQRFIVADAHTGVAITLWVVFTWLITWFKVSPLLIITSPEKRCGKTHTLDFIGRLSCRPLLASNISPAAIFRVIEAYSPTLVIDEADTFLKENEELRGVINSGHTRPTAFVFRCVGDDQEPRRFSTWAAKAIAGIGHLAPTLTDRAVEAPLRRKLPAETCERLRHADPEIFSRLASKLARFAEDCGSAIGAARPELPDALNDRAQDNWEPLLAIADYAGRLWPDLARAAALAMADPENVPGSTPTELLADIKEVFSAKKLVRLHTADLLGALIADDTKAWATYSYGKPISAHQLGRLLGEFGVHSKDVKIEKQNRKGYSLTDFEDAFTRYLLSPSTPLDSPLPATSQQPRGSSGSTEVAVALPSATSDEPVADQSATRYPSATAEPSPRQESSGVAVSGEGVAGAPIAPDQGGRKGRAF